MTCLQDPLSMTPRDVDLLKTTLAHENPMSPATHTEIAIHGERLALHAHFVALLQHRAPGVGRIGKTRALHFGDYEGVTVTGTERETMIEYVYHDN